MLIEVILGDAQTGIDTSWVFKPLGWFNAVHWCTWAVSIFEAMPAVPISGSLPKYWLNQVLKWEMGNPTLVIAMKARIRWRSFPFLISLIWFGFNRNTILIMAEIFLFPPTAEQQSSTSLGPQREWKRKSKQEKRKTNKSVLSELSAWCTADFFTQVFFDEDFFSPLVLISAPFTFFLNVMQG